jgi:transposase
LQRAEAADEFIEMTLDECPDCGEDLTGVEVVEKQTRQ